VSATALWPDARESLRIEAYRRRLVRLWQRATLPRRLFIWLRVVDWTRRVVRWAVPALFALWPMSPRDLFGLWSAVFWLLVVRKWTRRRSGTSAAPRFGAFALLHMPSRSGLLAALWLRSVPWLLWVGGCAVALVARLSGAAATVPVAVASIALAPVAAFGFLTWRGLANDRDDWTLRVFGGSVLYLLAACLAVVSLAGVIAGLHGDSAGWVSSLICAALAAAIAYAARGQFHGWRARRPRRDSASRVVLRYSAVFAVAGWALAILFAICGKRHDLAATVDALGWWTGPLALAPVLFSGCVFVADQFEWMKTAEAGVFAAKPRTLSWRPSVGRSRDFAAPSGQVRPGRGLWRAQWRKLREEKLSAPDSIVYVAMSLRGPVFAAVALAMPAQTAEPLFAWLAWTAPRFVEIDDREIDRLRLFGLGIRTMAAHDLRALLLAAALPTVAAGVIAGSIAGWTHARVATLALVAAGFVLRAGFAGLGYVARRFGRVAFAAMVVVWMIAASAAGAFLLPGRDPDAAILIALAVVPGLIGIAFNPLFRSESSLLDERRRLAEGPQRKPARA
jgi:hypothetical protein